MRFASRPSLVVLIACLTAVASCAGVVRGSGHVVVEERTVSSFTEVELVGSATVVLDRGSSFHLEVEAEDNIIDVLETRVSGDRLVLGEVRERGYMATEPVVFRVTSPSISALEVSGSGSVTAGDVDEGRMDVRVSGSGSVLLRGDIDDLRVVVDGSGRVDVTGAGDRLRIEISGSGSFDGTEFSVGDTDVSVSGSGEATVAASGRLDVEISGSGTVSYLGEPERLVTDISGSGSVNQR